MLVAYRVVRAFACSRVRVDDVDACVVIIGGPGGAASRALYRACDAMRRVARVARVCDACVEIVYNARARARARSRAR